MILACHGIQKSFGEHLIVRDGSFHIEDHEKAAIVGINGAGKSTLLKCLNRMNDLVEGCRISGSVRLDGEDI